jgi:phage terminase small subunit
MGKTNKLTDKQRAFVKNKLENPGISNYQAAIKAGYSTNTALDAKKNILDKHGIRALIERLIGDDVLAAKLNEGTEAYKQNNFTGEITPDYAVRRLYLSDILELKGYKQVNVLQQFNVGGDMSLEFTK